MSEHLTMEVAHHLSKSGDAPITEGRFFRVIEVLEVIVLASVAIMTAWAGYQASKWEGRQVYLYGVASSDRFKADAETINADAILSANVQFLASWLGFTSSGNTAAANLMTRRFTPEYAIAFHDWVKLDPLHNPKAPPGPSAMPSYVNVTQLKAEALNRTAEHAFAEGTDAQETADKYGRNTVLFASVMFLIAIAQRMRRRELRIAILAVAGVLLTVAAASLFTLPQL
jgi:hypothetical protein